jgi:hypothetical protein
MELIFCGRRQERPAGFPVLRILTNATSAWHAPGTVNGTLRALLTARHRHSHAVVSWPPYVNSTD